MTENKDFARYLTSILRHQAINFGYCIDHQGFVSVDEILYKCKKTINEINEIVTKDDKNRFELINKEGKLFIRAVQGHSIKLVDPILNEITDPKDLPIVIHGTNDNAYASIKIIGLKRMSRTHIHFAHGKPNDPSVISGIRKTCNVLIYIDIPKAMAACIKFYKSKNGVILSEGINGIITPEYFLKIEFLN